MMNGVMNTSGYGSQEFIKDDVVNDDWNKSSSVIQSMGRKL